MTNATPPAPPLTRQQLYTLLIVLAASLTLGRIVLVERFFGDNDGARWLTAEALCTYGEYWIGERIEYPDGEYVDRGLLFKEIKDGKPRSIDVVLRPDPAFENRDAKGSVPARTKRFYASKPLLLTTLMGQLANVVRQVGQFVSPEADLSWEKRGWVYIRIGLIIFNWLPFVLMLLIFASWAEQFGTTDWGRVTAVAIACFGTFLTTFVTTINNHALAAAAVCFTLYFLLQTEKLSAWRALAAGFWAGFTVTCELPAAAFLALAAFDLLRRRQWSSLVLFVLGAILPLAAQTGLNYQVLGTWQPVQSQFGSAWYVYPGSYWAQMQEIDAANDPKPMYLFHLLLGHHGFFSLSPILLAGLWGMISACQPSCTYAPVLRDWGRMSLLMFVVVVAFYTMTTNNFGGWTLGLRWLFWLIPFFLLLQLPVLDAAVRQPSRRVWVVLALAWSVFTAFHVGINPWQHPWLYRWLREFGLAGY